MVIGKRVGIFGSVQKRGRYLFREKVESVGGGILHPSICEKGSRE